MEGQAPAVGGAASSGYLLGHQCESWVKDEGIDHTGRAQGKGPRSAHVGRNVN